MLKEIELKHFKCFKHLRLPMQPLTVLSGVNASGKSSIIQALLLLRQTMQADEYATSLLLNGPSINLGTVTDIVNQISSRSSMEIGLMADAGQDVQFGWQFEGDRNSMAMDIAAFLEARKTAWEGPDPIEADFRYLVPTSKGILKRKSDIEDFAFSLGFGLQYLAAERAGPQEIYPLGQHPHVATMLPDGSNAAGLLLAFGDREVPEGLRTTDSAQTFQRQVQLWMQEFFPGFEMEVSRVPYANSVALGMRTSSGLDLQRPSSTGFGITQVLPIVVAALSPVNKSMLLIENPEVHLHSAGQSRMGQFLSQVAKAGIQVIVETHSDHVLNGIRRSVKSGMLKGSEVGLHFFRSIGKDSLAQVESLAMDDAGRVEHWPKGFFDQFDEDLSFLVDWIEQRST